MNEQRADAFATGTSAAAVLPTQTLNEVISKARDMGGIMSVCRSFNRAVENRYSVWNAFDRRKRWHTEGAAVVLAVAPSVPSITLTGTKL